MIPAIASKNDLIVYDELSHASTNLGIKLSKAKNIKFMHNDTNHVENILKKNRPKYRSCFLLTEGVFSMDGDTADLKALSFLAKKYNSSIILDDAHGFGVLGEGRGSQFEFKPTPKIFVEETVIDGAKALDFSPDKVDSEQLAKWLEDLAPEEFGKYKM